MRGEAMNALASDHLSYENFGKAGVNGSFKITVDCTEHLLDAVVIDADAYEEAQMLSREFFYV